MEDKMVTSAQLRQLDRSDYTSVFIVNLESNRISPVRIGEPFDAEFAARFTEGADYRRIMLSFFLSRAEKNEQERLIQLFLPQRLSGFLHSH